MARRASNLGAITTLHIYTFGYTLVKLANPMIESDNAVKKIAEKEKEEVKVS